MAAGGDGKLTGRHITRLAVAISSTAMETLAVGYLEIDEETVKSLKAQNVGNHQAFSREIIRKWANKNTGPNQIKNLAALLYEAAGDDGEIDPDKIYDILKITQDEAKSTAPPAASSAIAPTQIPAATSAAAAQSDRKLTDDMIVSLTELIDNEEELVKIGTKGLKMKNPAVKKHINSSKSITVAAHNVVTDWVKTKRSRVAAFTELCDALEATGFAGLISEAWES